MKQFKQNLSAILLIGFMFLGVATQINAQDKKEINDLLNQLNGKLTDFQYNVNDEVNRNSIDQSDEIKINDSLGGLRADIEDFQQNLNKNRATQNDVSQIIDSASAMNDYLLSLRLNAKTQNDWKAVRNLLDQIASNYNVQTSWNKSLPRQTNVSYSGNNDLTGTYQLDVSRSDNVRQIAEEAINSSNTQNRDEALQDLQSKLESPDNLAIEIRGNQAIVASSLSPQNTFSADGKDRSQTLSDGSTIRTRATLRGQELTISRLGSDNDYTVTFSPIDNGQSLKVTRRVTTDYLSQTVFAESIYTKTDSVARLEMSDNQGNSPSNTNAGNYPTTTPTPIPTTNNPTINRTPRTGQYVVPNGEIITGTLDNMISTKVSQNNDRFRLTVTGPNQFRGAVIEGYITGIDRSNRNPVGKSKLTLNFETIRLASGENYDFAGFLQSVTDSRGKTIKVDEEGTLQKSQTKETLKRSGIGAGAGAVLGAIFGGAKGAVIGATIGAGAGAGTVALENKGDLELEQGSAITIQASSPITK